MAKLAEVLVGGTYLTKVGETLRAVVVTGVTERRVFGRYCYAGDPPNFRTVFRVADKKTGNPLPKARGPAALRVTNGARFALTLPAIVKGLAALAA